MSVRWLWLPVLLLGLLAPLLRAEDVPFVETFEDRSVGYLKGQRNWGVTPREDVQVQRATVYAGNKAGVVGTNSIMTQFFSDPAATNVWVDFYARVSPRTPAEQPALRKDAVAGFYFDASGHIVARSNETWVTLSSVTIPAGAWRRFTINIDYNSETWGIYVAGDTPNELTTPVATNLSFTAGATNTYFRRFSVKN